MRGLLQLALAAALAAGQGPIRFEDAAAASGIRVTHSFGAQKLGSLLESTGAGCAWFDFNNDGRQDL
ncbi:MAG: CRTAC1 family protein, partial [Acidobacteria bacterium]|nr:CRTAC1 family protein [Acidobacteriota bacterium]